MSRGDEVLYPNPGYPIYESQIKTLHGIPVPYGFIRNEKGFGIDLQKLVSNITPKTKLLIYNNYSNPTSAVSSKEEMEEIAKIAMKHNLWVLNDTAYDDMLYEEEFRSIVSIPGMKERTINLFTLSKTYAMTGWRIGAAIGPEEMIECFNKLNVNYESCTTHFVQWAAIEALTGSQEGAKKILSTLKERRDFAYPLINDVPGFKTFKPTCTFYYFVDATEAMKRIKSECYDDFWMKILNDTGVSFTTREHFGTPLPDEQEKYIRLSYSGIEKDQIEEGLTKLKEYVNKF
jgi:aspartate/methionine/tyrosine aminotransferase